MSSPRTFIAVLAVAECLLLALLSSPAAAVDYVDIKHDGVEKHLVGTVLDTTTDGGLMLLATDGAMWPVTAELMVRRSSDDVPFAPLSPTELGKRLLTELPAGFEIHATQNYLICHNTSKAYAQWCGGVFEQLYRAFTNYWTRKGFELHKPDFPLVAIVFADKHSYASFARPDLGDAGESIIGYYSFQSNRMTMYDLTGVESLRRPGDRRTSAAQINEMLTRPEAERTVATILHEATHQLAFNTGLQIRFSDTPLWVSEGLAVFFETPDLRSSKGWSAIGSVNYGRLNVFFQTLRGRPPNSLELLLSDDSQFRGARAGDVRRGVGVALLSVAAEIEAVHRISENALAEAASHHRRRLDAPRRIPPVLRRRSASA